MRVALSERQDEVFSAPTTSSSEAPPGFRPVDAGIPVEVLQRDGTTLVVEAYVVAWVILLVFVLSGSIRQRRLEARIARLESTLRRAIEEKGNTS